MSTQDATLLVVALLLLLAGYWYFDRQKDKFGGLTVDCGYVSPNDGSISNAEMIRRGTCAIENNNCSDVAACIGPAAYKAVQADAVAQYQQDAAAMKLQYDEENYLASRNNPKGLAYRYSHRAQQV